MPRATHHETTGAPTLHPAKHDAAYVENRVADLETWIAWTLDRQKEKEGPAAEPIEPTVEDSFIARTASSGEQLEDGAA